jgi:hypothetical protein
MAGSTIEFPSTGEVFALSITDSMNPSRSADVTDHEVEDGSNISDHRIRNARTLSISGFVSDVPLDMTGDYDPENPEGNHVYVRERLERADENSEFINIDLGPTRGTYDNMLITSLDFSWDAESGNGLMVSLGAKEIRIAAPKSRNLSKEAIANQRILVKAEVEFEKINQSTLGTAIVAKDKIVAERFQSIQSFGRTTLSRAEGALADVATTTATGLGLP